MSIVPVRRALISVSDKSGLIELAAVLASHGVELVSTGGTAAALRAAGFAVRDVSDLTGFPEMMDGRLKTLHPRVHGGLLAVRGNAAHEASMAGHGIAPIDLLVVNLYPFEQTVAAGRPFEDCVEMIDIGGPAMIRAAAKNHACVAVVVDPRDYAELIAEIEGNGSATGAAFRRRLALEAFSATAAYDAAISGYLAREESIATPRRMTFAGTLRQRLRYGENPHQWAALYASGVPGHGVAGARQVQGKELSYNNIADTDAALELVAELSTDDSAAVAIIKHANPCGAATAAHLADAYRKALRTDPVSAFGGIIALNRTLDVETAAEIVKIFTEVIIAPDADADALAVIRSKANLRLLLTGGIPSPAADGVTIRAVTGGFLAQSRDNGSIDGRELKVVTKRAPTPSELADLRFAFKVAKHVRSNAIVYAKDGATAGIGAGQMSRIDSTRIAAWKAAEAARTAGLAEPLTHGSVVASDAFFPFADGLIAAADAGATAIIQPGGSVKDDEVIRAADERGLAMVLTGLRHFRH
jgi:phosphoribosylaminoimidazolecarboxamide formyltransferase/IMP cyclohydrolase